MYLLYALYFTLRTGRITLSPDFNWLQYSYRHGQWVSEIKEALMSQQSWWNVKISSTDFWMFRHDRQARM